MNDKDRISFCGLRCSRTAECGGRKRRCNRSVPAFEPLGTCQTCHDFMTRLRWPDGKVICPCCGSDEVCYLPNAKVFKCYQKHEKAKFSRKVGTVMEDSPIGLDKWLPVFRLIVNCKNGVSSWEIHRAIRVTQKTAWFMLQRARLAMQDNNTGGKLGGEVEVDETYIGGKIRNMHKERKQRAQKDSQLGDEGIVLGILERATEKKSKRVRAAVIKDRKAKSMQRLLELLTLLHDRVLALRLIRTLLKSRPCTAFHRFSKPFSRGLSKVRHFRKWLRL